MRNSKRLILGVLGALVLLLGAVAAAAWWWLMERAVPMVSSTVDYVVETGMGPRHIARHMAEAGIEVHEDSFVLLARYAEADKRLRAGAYQAEAGDSLWDLLQRMVEGNMQQTRLTLVEGWSFAQMMRKIAEHPQIRHTLADHSAEEIAQILEIDAPHPEGLFHPDTYVFAPGTKDIDILRRAYETQVQILDQLWAQRADDLPLATPYEALILASIVEKETGHAEDRHRVAGVFINRLKKGMLLQTDPTVIYGMGERYQGRIRKSDLTTDTPWNTYTRPGLPPTPIALPGTAALEAVLNPEVHDYYYFVARGDGTSEFSKNLSQHNRAVAKYILGRR